MEIIELPVIGVEDEAENELLKKELVQTSGVQAWSLSQRSGKAQLQFDRSLVSLDKIIHSIQRNGFKVPVRKQLMMVEGMSCASCSNTVEEQLNNSPGVVNATVNLANSTAEVEWVDGATSVRNLQQQVHNAGYELKAPAEIQSVLSGYAHQEYKQLQKQVIGSAILSVPVVAYGMLWMHAPFAGAISWVLTTIILVFYGQRFFSSAYRLAKIGRVNMNTLVAISTGVSFLYSTFNILYPYIAHVPDGHNNLYFESVAVTITMVLLGKLMESRARLKTSFALEHLINLKPTIACIIDAQGNTTEKPVEQVNRGELILVKAGEKIPLDGIIREGNTQVDESALTGESLPVAKEAGSKVFAGTLNQSGSFKATVTGRSEQTVLSRIVSLVQSAQSSKAPVQQLVNKVVSIFVPVVMGIALISALGWLLMGGTGYWTHAITAFVSVLVVACPCALGLATPTAIMVGIGKGAANGILIKHATAFDQLSQVDAVVLDKTGTITEGKPKVKHFHLLANADAASVCSIAKGMAAHSDHPLSVAVAGYFKEKGYSPASIQQFVNHPGKGTTASSEGQVYAMGSIGFLKELGVTIPDTEFPLGTVVAISKEKELLAFFEIADSMKAGSAEAVTTLEKNGVQVYMLTGDHEKSAAVIAANAGIKNYKAQMLPHEKLAFVKQLQDAGLRVAMAGDGINDSPALAQADVGIAMGAGSDTAIEVADVTLMRSNLSSLVSVLRLSKMVKRKVRQNLFWAFIYNIITIPIAAGWLYAFTGEMLSPAWAAAAMALSSVSVVMNSLLLQRENI